MTWGLAKKMTFRKLEPLFEGFRYEYLIKRMLSMRLITKKKFKRAPNRKIVWDALGTLIKGSRKIFKKFYVLKFYGGVNNTKLLSVFSAF